MFFLKKKRPAKKALKKFLACGLAWSWHPTWQRIHAQLLMNAEIEQKKV